mmetsp:Transcript_26678/g.55071  ORF Transcript_26678/g.55071 Transcript_26678/m.55071 type:complete len:426 (+) Transcript_26678:902-2179(+)
MVVVVGCPRLRQCCCIVVGDIKVVVVVVVDFNFFAAIVIFLTWTFQRRRHDLNGRGNLFVLFLLVARPVSPVFAHLPLLQQLVLSRINPLEQRPPAALGNLSLGTTRGSGIGRSPHRNLPSVPSLLQDHLRLSRRQPRLPLGTILIPQKGRGGRSSRPGGVVGLVAIVFAGIGIGEVVRQIARDVMRRRVDGAHDEILRCLRFLLLFLLFLLVAILAVLVAPVLVVLPTASDIRRVRLARHQRRIVVLSIRVDLSAIATAGRGVAVARLVVRIVVVVVIVVVLETVRCRSVVSVEEAFGVAFGARGDEAFDQGEFGHGALIVCVGCWVLGVGSWVLGWSDLSVGSSLFRVESWSGCGFRSSGLLYICIYILLKTMDAPTRKRMGSTLPAGSERQQNTCRDERREKRSMTMRKEWNKKGIKQEPKN